MRGLRPRLRKAYSRPSCSEESTWLIVRIYIYIYTRLWEVRCINRYIERGLRNEG